MSAKTNGKITVHTIGFTKKSAKDFFELLTKNGVKKLVDIRINTTSQLAGFAKRDDLRYFLNKVDGISYEHQESLAPTPDMLKAYRAKKLSWKSYEKKFRDLVKERKIENEFNPEDFVDVCLLCSEATAEKCHRRLVAEYLNRKWGNRLTVKHL